PRRMVSHRESHRERQLSPGENDYPKGEEPNPQSSGDFMSRGQHKATKAPSHRGRPLQKIFTPALLCALVPLWLCVDLTAQTIYAENQIPARGVEVAYTVTIKNPASHLYDVQMSIKGIRETSLSISMPAWSPGIYRIENYARNIQDFRAST